VKGFAKRVRGLGMKRLLRESMYLEVWREGVGEPHVARECTEDEVPHLDAVGRNHVTEGEVVVTEELREVVEQYQ